MQGVVRPRKICATGKSLDDSNYISANLNWPKSFAAFVHFVMRARFHLGTLWRAPMRLRD
jgi:hypothetical protein